MDPIHWVSVHTEFRFLFFPDTSIGDKEQHKRVSNVIYLQHLGEVSKKN